MKIKKYLIEESGKIRAEIEINSISKDLYSGIIIKEYFTIEQKELFKEFELLVNDQVLSLLDKIEKGIEDLGFKIKGEQGKLLDLQIWNLKEISYEKK